jgi:hypothetical protein
MSIVTGLGYEVPTPPAPSIVVSTTVGSLDFGNYSYKVTYVNAYGETLPSVASNVINPFPSTSFAVTIPVSTNTTVTGRNLYRTAASGVQYNLVTLINDNTTTLYIDGLDDDSLGVAPPTTPSAMSAQVLLGNVRLNQPIQTSGVIALTAGTTQSQAGALVGAPIGLNQFATLTTGNANDGTALPLLNSHLVGLTIYINNVSANALKVYPNTGQTINNLLVNQSVTQAASSARWYVATTASNWVQV